MEFPIIPLPLKYNALTEVDNVAWNGFPDRLKHHPFVYAATNSEDGKFGLVTLSKHGLGGFYKLATSDLQADPATVAYKVDLSLKDGGCMVHVHRDLPGAPARVEVKVETTDVVVKTVLADDVSHPGIPVVAPEPTPLCYVERMGNGSVVIHCMVYLEDTGLGVDLDALRGAVFVWKANEWLLDLPLKQDAKFKEALQYVAITAVAKDPTPFNKGGTVRVKLNPVAPSTSFGRSFAFEW